MNLLLVYMICYAGHNGGQVCIFKPVPTITCFVTEKLECIKVPYQARRMV